MTYLLIKSLHLLFVIAWMATVFYLPRILVNMAEAANEPAVQARLQLMGRRLYKFGHNMFGIAFLFGLVLWQGWRVFPQSLPNVASGTHWIDAKLTSSRCCWSTSPGPGDCSSAAQRALRCPRRARCAGSTSCRCCCCWA